MDSAKVVNDDEGQVVLLPEGYHLPGDYAFVKRIGQAVLLLPSDSPRDVLVEDLDKSSDDFTLDGGQPEAEQVTDLPL